MAAEPLDAFAPVLDAADAETAASNPLLAAGWALRADEVDAGCSSTARLLEPAPAALVLQLAAGRDGPPCSS